jgi:hypothetical protein
VPNINGCDVYVCQGSENSKFVYLPVKFNKLQVAALLDSGSSINIMSEELYHRVPNSCKSGINSCNTDTVKLPPKPNSLCGGKVTRLAHLTFAMFCEINKFPKSIEILFSIRNPYINRFTNHFSIHS